MNELPMIATVAEVAAWLGWTEAKLRNRLQRVRGIRPMCAPGARSSSGAKTCCSGTAGWRR